jgi:hypothetical protein
LHSPFITCVEPKGRKERKKEKRKKEKKRKKGEERKKRKLIGMIKSLGITRAERERNAQMKKE